MKQHKWYREICAWANGEIVEGRWKRKDETWSDWATIEFISVFGDNDWEYRIKPQHKEPQYLYVYSHKETSCINYMLKDKPKNMSDDYIYIGKLELKGD